VPPGRFPLSPIAVASRRYGDPVKPLTTAVMGGLSALLLAACTGGSGSPTPGVDTPASAQAAAVIARFASVWPTHSVPKFADLVDRPAAAASDIKTHMKELEVSSMSVAPSGELDCGDRQCREAAKVSAELAGAGNWSYVTQITAQRRHAKWLVQWTPGTFHPDLTPVTTFVRHRTLPARAPLLDRNGVALTPERAIVRIGVVPRQVRRVTYTRLADLLPVDIVSLRERVTAAQPDWFVPVIDLRAADYQPLRARLSQVPGLIVDQARRALAPSPEWGQAVLGTVGPATTETLKHAGPYALSSDEIGTSGLQLAYQQRLAGRPGIAIDLVEKGATGRLVNTVLNRRPRRGEPLETSLDLAAQNAAEHAVAHATQTTALVAVKASTGEILAAANAPGPTTYNAAFVGRYAPGSTFKTVTAAALLGQDVVASNTPVRCPDSITVGGKVFTNYAVGILPGNPTFADAFAASCNTAFVSFAKHVTGDELATTAQQFGLGAPWDIGLDAYSGSVPADSDLVTRAADMIGQGHVEASPLAMAMVAAAADSGVARTPTLLPGLLPGSRLDELNSSVVKSLQTLMRMTVTSGTASLVDLPGLPVYAKTGTAEYDVGGSIGTNAWLIGYRGDLAFAVLVENGESGGHDAAPLAAAFLTSLPKRIYQ
jgi:cell division protein FtsI/penicillin-binding protein 2